MSKAFQILALFAAVALVAGCANLAQNVYDGVVTVPGAVELAREAYIDHVNTCHCVTSNEFALAQGYYTAYQTAAANLSAQAAVYGTNAVTNAQALQALTSTVLSTAGSYISIVEAALPAPNATALKAKISKTIPTK